MRTVIRGTPGAMRNLQQQPSDRLQISHHNGVCSAEDDRFSLQVVRSLPGTVPESTM
jgi:hypothetical protein